jgi:hypothetical protein
MKFHHKFANEIKIKMNMKTKLICVMMALMCLAPVYSMPLNIRMKATFQHGRARIPSITRVNADY